MLELFLTIIVVAGAVMLIKRKHDPKVIMFLSGILLMFMAILLGKSLLSVDETTGIAIFDVFKVSTNVFYKQLTGASFILMLLFGYTAYMNEIKATDVTIDLLSKPLKKAKSPTAILLGLFIIGNLLCIIIPSASSLSVLMMSTLFPVFVRAGISPMAVIAIIATSATIAPTPLGADNIVAAQSLGISVTDYVFNYHAKISIPALFAMGLAHIVWSRYLDKKEGLLKVEKLSETETVSSDQRPIIYGVLPLLPLLFMVYFGVFNKEASVGITEVTFFALVIAVMFEVIRTQSLNQISKNLTVFFEGMGRGFTSVVAQVVSAMIFVEGLKLIGVITLLSDYVSTIEGAGVLLVFVFCALAIGIGLLSGSGLATFYAFVEIMPNFAMAANISPILLAIPMQFVSHFVKSVSPVSPTVIITSSMSGVTPFKVIKRTIVPVLVATIVTLVLSFILL
ncbi:MAG TPA: C4-dicarboxylate ABC transporter [Firmicutes bacterium]|nr:C4-dicarboxylate ABC transporter [Bacillota bacterium]